MVRAALALFFLASFAGSAVAQGNGRLQLHFIAVGQGDGAVLITPGGETVLFDNGVLNNCDPPLAYLRRLGVTRIDYHIASHYHADHIGCTEQVFAAFPLQHVAYDRGGSYTTATYTRYVRAVGNKRQTVPVGSTLVLDGGVELDFIAANGAGVAGADDENDLSVVVRVQYGAFDALIAGDLSGMNAGGYADVESAVAADIGRVEVMKVNHHGSRYSSNTNFLNAIGARVGVVPVGAGNPYGHPTADTMRRLHNAGVITYWTSVGAGARPDPLRDIVGGDVSVDVPPGGTEFTVSSGGHVHSYESWGLTALPGAPQGLSGRSESGTVTLDWRASDAGGAPTGYAVEAALTRGGPAIATLSAAGTTLTVSNVPSGTYYVRVRALNTAGASEWSSEIEIVVFAGVTCVAAPDAPRNLVASVVRGSVTLTWTPAGSGCEAVRYGVFAGSAPGGSNLAQLDVQAATALTVSAPPGTYYVRVVALNAFGASGASNEVVIVVTGGG